MSMSEDEDVIDNPVFYALRQQFVDLFATVKQRRGVVAIPSYCTLPDAIDRNFVGTCPPPPCCCYCVYVVRHSGGWEEGAD